MLYAPHNILLKSDCQSFVEDLIASMFTYNLYACNFLFLWCLCLFWGRVNLVSKNEFRNVLRTLQFYSSVIFNFLMYFYTFLSYVSLNYSLWIQIISLLLFLNFSTVFISGLFYLCCICTLAFVSIFSFIICIFLVVVFSFLLREICLTFLVRAGLVILYSFSFYLSVKDLSFLQM